jgi:CDP-glucose 4,6-dehydratase
MQSLITGSPLELRSDGSYVRDFLYVKDVVRGYLLLAENLPNIVGEAFNFGSQDTYSVLDALKQLEIALDRPIPYTILNKAKNEIPYQSLDFSKIRNLGWEPQDTLQSTGKAIFNWYKDNSDSIAKG